MKIAWSRANCLKPVSLCHKPATVRTSLILPDLNELTLHALDGIKQAFKVVIDIGLEPISN